MVVTARELWSRNEIEVGHRGATTQSFDELVALGVTLGRRPASRLHVAANLGLAAYTELRLARRLVDDRRLPWERPLTPAQLTPARVRRGFRRLRASLGTPASPPKPSTPGPGRPKGTRRPPRTRYPAVKKMGPRV
jgi:hypothetical protein